MKVKLESTGGMGHCPPPLVFSHVTLVPQHKSHDRLLEGTAVSFFIHLREENLNLFTFPEEHFLTFFTANELSRTGAEGLQPAGRWAPSSGSATLAERTNATLAFESGTKSHLSFLLCKLLPVCFPQLVISDVSCHCYVTIHKLSRTDGGPEPVPGGSSDGRVIITRRVVLLWHCHFLIIKRF